MNRFLGKFATASDVASALENGELNNPYVAYIVSADTIDYNGQVPDPKAPYRDMPLTIEMLSAGTVTIDFSSGNDNLKYKVNNAEWVKFDYHNNPIEIEAVAGDKIQVASSGNTYKTMEELHFGIQNPCNVYGNIMSLLDENNYPTMDTLDENEYGHFQNVFSGSTGIISAEYLILPVTSLTEYCYQAMFKDCTSLTIAPDLLATVAIRGYGYYEMFNGCTSLNYIKCLLTNPDDEQFHYPVTYEWLSNASSTGTFVKKSGVNWSTGTSGIPEGWTVIEV